MVNLDKMPAFRSLTARRQRFVVMYCTEAGFNGVEAARLAKYSSGTARQQASRLLSMDSVKAAVSEYTSQQNSDFIGSAYMWVNPMIKCELLGIAGGNVRKAETMIDRVLLGFINGDRDARSAIHRRDGIASPTRYSVLHRAGFKCQACGERPHADNDITLHIDHIIPVSWGGSSEDDNLQVLCQECNLSKGNRFVYDHNKEAG